MLSLAIGLAQEALVLSELAAQGGRAAFPKTVEIRAREPAACWPPHARLGLSPGYAAQARANESRINRSIEAAIASTGPSLTKRAQFSAIKRGNRSRIFLASLSALALR